MNDAMAEIKTLTFNALTRHQSNALTDISGTLNFSLRYLFSRFPFGSSQTVYQPVALTFLIRKLEVMSRAAAFTSFCCKAKVLSNNMEKFSNDCKNLKIKKIIIIIPLEVVGFYYNQHDATPPRCLFITSVKTFQLPFSYESLKFVHLQFICLQI